MLDIIAIEDPKSELVQDLLDDVIEWLLNKLPVPGMNLLFTYITSGLGEWFGIEKGNELFLTNSGEEFVKAYLERLEMDVDARIQLQSDLKSVGTLLEKCQTSKSFLSNELKDLKAILKDSRNDFEGIIRARRSTFPSGDEFKSGLDFAVKTFSKVFKSIYNKI